MYNWPLLPKCRLKCSIELPQLKQEGDNVKTIQGGCSLKIGSNRYSRVQGFPDDRIGVCL